MGAVTCLGLLLTLVVSAAMPAAAAMPDPDSDGLPTSYELRVVGTDPRRADTDGDGIPDGAEDGAHSRVGGVMHALGGDREGDREGEAGENSAQRTASISFSGSCTTPFLITR